MSVKAVVSYDQFKEIIKSSKPSVFDFWATWCGPCRVISPIFEKLAENFSEKVDFYKVDVDEQQEISQEVGITAMPTFMAFKDGTKIDSTLGANPAALEKLIAAAAAVA